MNKIFETPLYPYKRSADQDAVTPVRHPVIIIGAGPIGLTLAADLALKNIPAIVLDDNDKVSFGSRAVCISKRALEILDRLGCGTRCVDRGVTWGTGKVLFHDREVFRFDLLPEAGHRRSAFVNLQQYYLEQFLVEHLGTLRAQGHPVEIRGCHKLVGIKPAGDHVALEVETPDGKYDLEADWLIACDGANSPTRTMLGLGFAGRVFEDNFLIADVSVDIDLPTERRFWFDPPFNPGQSALMHRQPDNTWRIDLQLGQGIDKARETRRENVIPRLREALGPDVDFELEWVSVYTFQCRRMEMFCHGRVLFAGDSAHQVSPFGARGANSGIQDAENLAWKLDLVRQGLAPGALLDTYAVERQQAADENILASTRSTDFISPKSEISRAFRDAVLDLAERTEFAGPLINSGRLSVPCIHDGSPLNGADNLPGAPALTRPGAPASDAPLADGWLLDRLGGAFTVMAIGCAVPAMEKIDGIPVQTLIISDDDDANGLVRARYCDDGQTAVYLTRPDQHIVARWPEFDEAAVFDALASALALTR